MDRSRSWKGGPAGRPRSRPARPPRRAGSARRAGPPRGAVPRPGSAGRPASSRRPGRGPDPAPRWRRSRVGSRRRHRGCRSRARRATSAGWACSWHRSACRHASPATGVRGDSTLRGGPAVVPETCRLDCLLARPHAGRVRTPQQERSRATQQRLLDATVECLIEHGWSGTTTTLVAEKAGVSRGAQLHHYPTKAALVLAAVEHLAGRRAAEIRAEAASLPAGRSGSCAAVDAAEPDWPVRRLDRIGALLAPAFTGPPYVAALEG